LRKQDLGTGVEKEAIETLFMKRVLKSLFPETPEMKQRNTK
jgi:hypothetical protein